MVCLMALTGSRIVHLYEPNQREDSASRVDCFFHIRRHGVYMVAKHARSRSSALGGGQNG
jgi:hypothetical protein